MKSLSTTADFDTIKEGMAWAEELSKQFNLPISSLGFSYMTRVYNYKTGKYNNLNKAKYAFNVSLKPNKVDDEVVL